LVTEALVICTLFLGLPPETLSCEGVAWSHNPLPLSYVFTLSLGLLPANEVVLSKISQTAG